MSDLPRLTGHSPTRVSASWDVDEGQETKENNRYQDKWEIDNGSYRDLKVVEGGKHWSWGSQVGWVKAKEIHSVVENEWERARIVVK